MATKGSKSQWKPLSEFERQIGNRLGYLRRHYGVKQSVFAEQVGLTRTQLSNVESGRVPLKIFTGWIACQKLGIHPSWLLSGGTERPFPPMDDARREWADRRFKAQRNSKFSDVWSGLAWLVADDSEEGKKFFARVLKQEHEDERAIISENKQLTPVSTMPITPEVKPQLPKLLERLKKATKERGKSTALAEYLGVPKESVSRWLAGRVEPSGEITLQLLEWVKQQGC